MKRILSVLLALSALTAQTVNAQTCPTNSTYKNQSGTFDLSAGRSIVLNSGGTFQITVQNNFSSTSSICVLNGSTVYLSFQNVNNIEKGGFINVDKNAKLNFTGSGINKFPLTVINAGTVSQPIGITYTDGATITNSGTYGITADASLNNGTIAITNSGTFNTSATINYNNGSFSIANAANSTMSIAGNLTLSNTIIKNSGTFSCAGRMTLQSSTNITNNNIMDVSGDISFSGVTFSNNGVLYIAGSTMINLGSTFNNTCTIKEAGNFNNDGTVNNTGTLILSGSLNNQGTFTNGTNGFVQGANFTNNKSVSGSGNFYFIGLTTNQGSFTGSSASSKINFYDATLFSSKYFDIENTTPTNISKKIILPILATSFESCSDVSAPVITTQPITQYLCSSLLTETKFSVTVTSKTTPTYQWYKNGSAVSGAISSTYNVTGLTLADTANVYTVAVTNAAGTTTSNGVSVKYIIISQPANLSIGVGSAFSFSVKTSGATGYQWRKGIFGLLNALLPTYSKSSASLLDSGKYVAIVTYAGGTCTSDTATLSVENTPSIASQPQTQVFCSSSTTSATFSVTATSKSEISYQWYKKGIVISGAKGSSYTATGLTLADTSNTYSVTVTNLAGTTTSNNASVKYIIISQPSPATLNLTTGNAASFGIKTSSVNSWQWQKNGSNVIGATTTNFTLSSVNYADSGKYTVLVRYEGGSCTSEAALLKTCVVLYSKSIGNLNQAATWGAATDGSGSTPVDFSREEHKFVVLNRGSVETGSDLTIAGTLDIANSKVVITPGTTLNVGRIIKSSTVTSAAGAIVGSTTSNLTVHGITLPAYTGASDLYFDKSGNTIKNLITAGHTVTLRSALNITSGKKPGILQVNSGTFNTSDSLTLKSDSLGTAGIAKSTGTIAGKVTIEKWVHARRAWRFIGAPISSVDAPTINAAWQEGATTSTANPHPGFGTHITGGIEPAGFDRSPSNNPSLKYMTTTGVWSGLPNTKAISVTQYPAYMLFVRGNRSYNILTTTAWTTPTTTTLRVTGNVYQGSMAAKTVTAKGFTIMTNPYASPVNFAKVVSASNNIKKRIRVWDPTLAGTYGVGAWVTLDGTSGTYRATPPSGNVSAILQAGQGFMIESGDGKNNGSLNINEDVKDFSSTTVSGDREGEETTADTSLEVNLKVFNADSTTGLADGVLYRFSAEANDSVDFDDAGKIMNFNENLGISEGSSILTIDNRTMPMPSDSLRLSLTGIKSTNYQLEFVPSSLQNKAFTLYDRYLNTTTTIRVSDTTSYTFNVNTSVAASKASNRFVIVAMKTKTVLPVTFTKIKAYLKDKAAQVEWNVQNELNIASYEIEKSTNGTSFIKAGTVMAKGTTAYSFTDATPANGITYYRVKSIGKSGDVNYTGIVHVETETTSNPAVSVYPNPLTGTTFTLTLTNMTAGSYTLSVITENGAVAFSKSITHNGGTASQPVNLHNKLASGIYYLKITAQNGKTSILKVAAN